MPDYSREHDISAECRNRAANKRGNVSFQPMNSIEYEFERTEAAKPIVLVLESTAANGFEFANGSILPDISAAVS